MLTPLIIELSSCVYLVVV